jgi:hypothetical protein
MIRTQVSLDEQDYKRVKEAAQGSGISMAEFLRRAVRGALSAGEPRPWMSFAGFVETGDPHSSQSVDGFVYGQANG